MPDLPASLMRHISSDKKGFWPTPWTYLLEAGRFQIPYFNEDDQLAWRFVGNNRGVNLRISEVPTLTEGWDFIPGVSEIFLIHSYGWMLWDGGDETLRAMLSTLATMDWEGRAKVEEAAMLTYWNAHRLVVEQGLALEEYPFFAYQVHHLLYNALSAVPGPWFEFVNLRFDEGVFESTPLAARPFVQYTRDPEKISDDPRITVAYITDDLSKVSDPTGRTIITPTQEDSDAE